MFTRAPYEENVKILKEWHSKQPHLPKDIDENIYYNILSGTKSIENSKSKLDAYLTLRNRVYNLFDVQPTSNEFIERFKKTGVVFMHGKTPKGYKVLYIALSKFGGSSGDDVIMCNMAIIEALQSLEPTGTSFITFIDFRHAKRSLAGTTLPRIKAYMEYSTKMVPVRVKKTILLGIPYFLDKGMSLSMTFAPKKFADRVVRHKDHTILQELMPAEMIPSDYGGQGPSLQELLDYWAGVLESKKEWFEKLSKLSSDESKRPKDSYKWDTMNFGIEGTFKALNID